MPAPTRVLNLYTTALVWLTASLAVGLALLARPVGAESMADAGRSQATHGPDVITATPTPGCDLAWRRFPSPNVGTGSSYLMGVSAISRDDAWAVGTTTSPPGILTIHWDGLQWSVVASPYPGFNISVSGITAISHDDVWAVGYYNDGRQLLTMHWNGVQWSVVPNPNPGGNYVNYLYAVDATASNDVWAVGFYRQYRPQGLVMHWDGTQWSVIPSPYDPAINYISGVDAVAPNDVWAVGYYGGGGPIPYQAFAMHWDGSGWTVTPTPDLGVGSYFQEIVALSPSDVWAVGYTYDGSAPQALSEHWNGSAWSVIPVPGGLSSLNSVDASAPNDVWAVDPEGTVIRWNGAAWSIVSIPGMSNFLTDIDLRAADDIWVVGHDGPTSGPYHTQTWRYSSLCLPSTSTPTPTPITPVPTATPTLIACVTLNDSITSSDPVQVGMVARTGLPSACPGGGCSSVEDTLLRHYKVYDFYFPYGSFSTGCFTVTIEATGCPGNLYSAAYTSFSPNFVCQNLKGSTGDFVSGSTSYSFTLYRGTTYSIVVHEAVPDSGCSGYSVKVSTTMGCYYVVTQTPTPGPSHTPTTTTTHTSTRTATGTATRTATCTATPSMTHTSTPMSTTLSTATALATYTPCALTFSDVSPDDTFHSYIRCLACRGIISGYDDGTFRPFNDITRSQIAKIVSNAAGFDEDPGPQVFEDVNDTNPFYQYINRLSNRGHMGGYPCGTVDAEPCIEPDNRPYFRPFANATRGQLAKIVANAANVGGTPSGVFYTDVEEEHPFYLWIMRLTDIGVMSGYDCGGEGEPCGSENRPYFRPYNNVTRGQASKIVANSFLPNCQTPAWK